MRFKGFNDSTEIFFCLILFVSFIPAELLAKRKFNYVERYPDKKLKIKAQTKKRKFHGRYVEYHPNGQVKAYGQYEKGKLEGEWFRFYENKKLKDRGHWSQNLPTGYWKIYDEEGKLQKSGSFACGQKSGYWKKEKSWKLHKPPSCWKSRLRNFRINGHYNHHNSEQNLTSGGVAWNPRLYESDKISLSFSLGIEMLREQREKLDTGYVGENKTIASSFWEFQLLQPLEFNTPLSLEYFIGRQEVGSDSFGDGTIYGLRLHFPPYLWPKYLESTYIGVKIFSHEELNFNQISIGVTF